MKILRPSSSAMWTACPGQPNIAELAPPEDPTDPAREGTCAAWVAEEVFSGAYENTKAMIGLAHPENHWVVEPDMAYHIQKYVDHMRRYGVEVIAEKKVTLNEFIQGTPDAYAVLNNGVLHVDDLKYGYDIVEPYLNTQIAIYAGAIVRLLLKGNVTINKVVIGVYQPRSSHPHGIHRTWEITVDELMTFVSQIETAGLMCFEEDPVRTPGKHCRYCPAAGICPENASANYQNYDAIRGATIHHLTREQLCTELKFLEEAESLIVSRRKAIKTEAIARIGRGEVLPGYVSEQGVGQRRFIKSMKPKEISALIGIPIIEEKTITVAEAERRGADIDLLKRFTEQPRTDHRIRAVGPDYYRKLFERKEGRK